MQTDRHLVTQNSDCQMDRPKEKRTRQGERNTKMGRGIETVRDRDKKKEKEGRKHSEGSRL